MIPARLFRNQIRMRETVYIYFHIVDFDRRYLFIEHEKTERLFQFGNQGSVYLKFVDVHRIQTNHVIILIADINSADSKLIVLKDFIHLFVIGLEILKIKTDVLVIDIQVIDGTAVILVFGYDDRLPVAD